MKQPLTISTAKFTLSVKGLVLTAGLLLGCFMGQAQIWEFSFGGPFEDQAFGITQARNNDFLLAGWSESFSTNQSATIVRLDVDGDAVWFRSFDEGFQSHAYDIISLQNGGYAFVGDIRQTAQTNNFDLYFQRLNENGDPVGNAVVVGGAENEKGNKLIETQDGGFLLVGRTRSFGAGENDAYLVKLNADGSIAWETTYGSTEYDEATGVVEVADGYVIAGSTKNPDTDFDFFLLKVNKTNGLEIWSENYDHNNDFESCLDLVYTSDDHFVLTGFKQPTTGGDPEAILVKTDSDGQEITDNWPVYVNFGPLGDLANAIIQSTADNDLYIVGQTEEDAVNVDILLAQISLDGNIVNVRSYGAPDAIDYGQDIIQRNNEGYAISGYNSAANNPIIGNDFTLVKTDNFSNTYTNYINGTVFYDLNGDCGIDNGEPRLEDWIVEATSSTNGRVFYGTTDADGNYRILVETDEYDVRVYLKNEYWEGCTDEINGITFSAPYSEVDGIDFGMHEITFCANLIVDVSAPFVTPCEDVEYTVTYINDGPEPALGAQVTIELDEDLTYNSASIPPTGSPNSQTYIFDIGDVALGAGGSFTVNLSASCDVNDNQAFSLKASATPNELCLVNPAWDQSSIEVKGRCEGDEVEFILTNAGIGDMTEPLGYIVIEDHVMGYTTPNDFILPAGDSMVVKQPANGSTYRILTEQSAFHPGREFPTVAIEGCVEGGGSDYTTGIVTEFPENDLNAFVSIDVQEGINTTDDLSLRGYPKGYKSDTLLANTDLKYHIFFQNNGPDTMYRVVIRDTLSAYLDVTTVQAGASSHNYDFRVYENGIVKFVFEDINLPPSTANEAGSKGFVQFRVAQQPNLPACTDLQNTAVLYQGYDEPALTSIVMHSICGTVFDFVDVVLTNTEEIVLTGVEINTFPNPFVGATTIQVSGATFKDLRLKLYDNTGRMLRQEMFQGQQHHLERGSLLPGIYFLQIEGDGQVLKVGKVIVK